MRLLTKTYFATMLALAVTQCHLATAEESGSTACASISPPPCRPASREKSCVASNCDCKVTCDRPAPSPEAAPTPQLQAAPVPTQFTAPPPSGAVAGESRWTSVRGPRIILPEISIGLPGFETASVTRIRQDPHVRLNAAIAPMSTGPAIQSQLTPYAAPMMGVTPQAAPVQPPQSPCGKKANCQTANVTGNESADVQQLRAELAETQARLQRLTDALASMDAPQGLQVVPSVSDDATIVPPSPIPVIPPPSADQPQRSLGTSESAKRPEDNLLNRTKRKISTLIPVSNRTLK